MNREECSERVRLVDEYGRSIAEFNDLLESLKAPSHHRNEGGWSAIAVARAGTGLGACHSIFSASRLLRSVFERKVCRRRTSWIQL